MGARNVDEETIRRWISENSSPGGSSDLQDVLNNGSDLTQSNGINMSEGTELDFNGNSTTGGFYFPRTSNFAIAHDQDDTWIGTEFYNSNDEFSDMFYNVDGLDLKFVTSGGVTGRIVISQSNVYLYLNEGLAGVTKLGISGGTLTIDDVPAVSGSFTSDDGKSITVTKGIITAITAI